MTRILLAILAFYKRWLSPAIHWLRPGGCRYVPTCSEYAAVAIATHGPWRGTGLAMWRLLRCHPLRAGARSGSTSSADKTFSPRTVTTPRTVTIRHAAARRSPGSGACHQAQTTRK